MAKKSKNRPKPLDKNIRKVGKRNLYILLALAAAGAAFVIVGATLS